MLERIQEIYQANVLIVDDKPANGILLQKILERDGYQNIKIVTDSREVEGLCCSTRFDVILLDIRMPFIDGFGVMALLSHIYSDEYVPVLVLTAQTDRDTRLKALEGGAKDFLTKPFDQVEVLIRIYNLLEIRLLHKKSQDNNKMLEEKVKKRTEELYETRKAVIGCLGLAAEYRDNETGCHIVRMSQLSYLLAIEYGLGQQQAEMILNTAPMHDVGKIGIPDSILLKQGKLTPEEWGLMKTHVAIGAKILEGHESHLMNTAKSIVLHHHEKWDGSGYPSGLKGHEISIEGRICAVADVFDALLSERPYKKSWTIDEAVAFVDQQSGKHFDPEVVHCFKKILPEILKIRDACGQANSCC